MKRKRKKKYLQSVMGVTGTEKFTVQCRMEETRTTKPTYDVPDIYPVLQHTEYIFFFFGLRNFLLSNLHSVAINITNELVWSGQKCETDI